MSKSKKFTKQKSSDSVFFKPSKIGEFVEGIFNGYKETDKSYCIVVGEKLISISTVIHSFLRRDELAKKLKRGKDTIKIVYIGDSKGRGRKARLFSFFVNGEQKEQDTAWSEASADDILNLPIDSKRKKK
jgi:hypothetical protein